MTHTHILRIGNATFTVKVRELPERIVAQVCFNPQWPTDDAMSASLFLSRIVVQYHKDPRPLSVHEANGKQLFQV